MNKSYTLYDGDHAPGFSVSEAKKKPEDLGSIDLEGYAPSSGVKGGLSRRELIVN